MQVLIAGAGIAGLSLVRALRGLDARIDLVERSPSFSAVGAGIVIHPNGMDALAQLGFADQVISTGNILRQMELNRGSSTVQIPLAEVWSGATYPTVSIFRPELHTILAGDLWLHGADCVSCSMGRRVVSIADSADRPVATFEDGATQAYDLIVAADGVHSAIRRSLFPDSVAMSTHLLYFRFPAKKVINLGSDTWQTFERIDASYGYIPIGPDRIHCFVQVRAELAPERDVSVEDLVREKFCPWDNNLGISFEARVGPVHAGLAYMVRPVNWGRGGCVFLGDAAHAVSPTLSEGGSLAIEDAVALGSALKTEATIAKAIQTFREARNERIRWAHRMALSQVNANRRARPEGHGSSAIAVNHLRLMYRPLLQSAAPSERVRGAGVSCKGVQPTGNKNGMNKK